MAQGDGVSGPFCKVVLWTYDRYGVDSSSIISVASLELQAG